MNPGPDQFPQELCRSRTLRRLLPPATLALLALALFLPSLPGTFLVDDWPIVAENPLVARGDVPAILTSDYWGPGANNAQYRPLTILSFAVNHALFGPQPLSFHVVNLLLHAAVVLVLFSLALRLELPLPAAWLAAALFAAHPIHLEAVNMIVGRAELLAALFGMLFLILARSPSGACRAGGLAALAAALLAKESAAVFPALLVALDLFGAPEPRAVPRSRRRLYGAVAAIVAAWLLLRLWVLGQGAAPLSPIDPHDNPLALLPAWQRLLSALKVQALYLARHVAPVGLHGVYDASSVSTVRTLFSPWGIGAAAFAIAAVALPVALWRRRSRAFPGVLLYLLGFLVTANLFFPHYVMIADRLAYLPSAGFCLALASLLGNPAQPAGRADGRGAEWRAGRFAAGLLYLAALAVVTLARNPAYRDPARLWEGTLAEEPGNARAWVYLGDVHGRAGDLGRAERDYRSAIAAAPRFPGGWDQLAYVLLLQGRGAEAVDVYRRELAAVGRDLPDVHLKLARTLIELDRADEALAELARVTDPHLEGARRALEERAAERLRPRGR